MPLLPNAKMLHSCHLDHLDTHKPLTFNRFIFWEGTRLRVKRFTKPHNTFVVAKIEPEPSDYERCFNYWAIPEKLYPHPA